MKKLIALLTALLLIAVFAGCGAAKTENNESEKPQSSSAEEKTESETESQTEKKAPEQFKAGLWEVVKDNARIGYYYFSADKTACSYHDSEGKSGVPFDYEITEDGYIFHMGSADNNTAVGLKAAPEGSDSTILVFDNREEEIKYLEDTTYAEYIEKQKNQ